MAKDSKAATLKRLNRIEGQVRGLARMVEDDRYCIDIVTQIAAVARAMEQVGFKLVASGLTYCLQHPEEAAESGYDLERVEKMFMKIG